MAIVLIDEDPATQNVVTFMVMITVLLAANDFPLDQEAHPSADSTTAESRLPASVNTTFGLERPNANDWENFAHPIPFTTQVLKGRIFTSLPIQPRDLSNMIDGGIKTTRRQISEMGGDTRLRARDNPYTSIVPGCHFRMRSTTTRGRGVPVMTYTMMRSVFLALEQVLEKDGRNFETSFVLTDHDSVGWGHGELAGSATTTKLCPNPTPVVQRTHPSVAIIPKWEPRSSSACRGELGDQIYVTAFGNRTAHIELHFEYPRVPDPSCELTNARVNSDGERNLNADER
ncbi:MAG: hypothetical protein Q9185_007149 [Variospora sp. 1 TL-2023]